MENSQNKQQKTIGGDLILKTKEVEEVDEKMGEQKEKDKMEDVSQTTRTDEGIIHEGGTCSTSQIDIVGVGTGTDWVVDGSGWEIEKNGAQQQQPLTQQQSLTQQQQPLTQQPLTQQSQRQEQKEDESMDYTVNLLGKRKMDRGREQEDEEELLLRPGGRSKSNRIISDDESQPSMPNKRVTRSQKTTTHTQLASSSKVISSDTDPPSQSCSEVEGGKSKGMIGRKSVRRKRALDEPTVSEMLRPLPQNSEELYNMPSTQVGSSVINWLEDIQTIRINSSYQGYLSGQMKKRVDVTKDAIRILLEKLADQGDPAYLRRRNAELVAELAVAKMEQARMKHDIEDLKRVVHGLKQTIQGQDHRQSQDRNVGTSQIEKATSPMEKRAMLKENRNRSMSKSCDREGSSDTWPYVEAEQQQQLIMEDLSENREVVMKPPLRGVSMPIVEPKKSQELMDRDAELSRQIVTLINRRKELRETLKERKSSPVAKGISKQRSLQQPNEKTKPRIVGNVQLVPPRNEVGMEQEHTLLKDAKTQPLGWEKVENRKTKRQRKKKNQQQQQQSQQKQQQQSKQQQQRQAADGGDTQKKRRPPRTAAVAIKGVEENFSYAAALKKLRENIKLSELDIDKSTIRRSANGGVLIELSGQDKTTKAETLKTKVSEVLGSAAVVTRPTIKGEVRLIGLDDSVVTDEVADTIALAGGCLSAEVKVGVIRPMSNGLYMAWAQCPLGAAIKAAQSGRIKIGWTVARIELLKARPIQCYKCWGYGHLRIKCTSAVDRSNTCFRCGVVGHPALTCQNPVRCVICVEQGREAKHRVGSIHCKAEFLKKKEGNMIERDVAENMDIDVPVGGSEDCSVKND